MKQLYYGNELEKDGYKILACSSGIPNWAVQIMTECASGINLDKECGLALRGDGAVLYMVSKVPPRLGEGEQRGTYFSHQYFISAGEMGYFIANMPSVLSGARFNIGYADRYDVTEKALPSAPVGSSAPAVIANAAKKALQNGCKMIIYSRNMTCDAAIDMMAALAGALSPEERKKAGFVLSNNARDKRLERASFIFCGESAANAMMGRFDQNCIYCNADFDKIALSFDLQMKLAEKENKEEHTMQTDRQMPQYTPRPSRLPSVLSVIALILAIAALACSVLAYMKADSVMNLEVPTEEETEATEEITESTPTTQLEEAETVRKSEEDEKTTEKKDSAEEAETEQTAPTEENVNENSDDANNAVGGRRSLFD